MADVSAVYAFMRETNRERQTDQENERDRERKRETESEMYTHRLIKLVMEIILTPLPNH